MTGNLSPSYRLRLDRLRRLRERFDNGEFGRATYEAMLRREGYHHHNAAIEVRMAKAERAVAAYKSLGDITGQIVKGLKPQ